MARTTFEQLQAILRTHPGARPVGHSNRGRTLTANSDKAAAQPPNPERHSRKCTICRHTQREEIEFDFLRWKSSKAIAQDYGLPHHAAVCRHARALGLFERRDQTIHFALEPILEQSGGAFMKVTPGTLVSAVAAYAKINDDGKRRRIPRINNIYFIGPEEIAGSGPGSTPEEIVANRELQKLVRQITR